MARRAPQLTDFQCAVQVKTRAICLHQNSSFQFPQYIEHLGLLGGFFFFFLNLRGNQVSFPLLAVLAFSATEPICGPCQTTVLPVHLPFAEPSPKPCIFLVRKQLPKVGLKRDGDHHGSSTDRHQECYKCHLSPILSGLFKVYFMLLRLLIKYFQY